MDVPIIGGQAHDQSEIAQGFQLYDHELEAAFKVLARLRERSTSRRDLDSFDREIRQRFEEIGLVVRVQWWDTHQDGVFRPDVDIIGRTHHEEFDFDRQVHEATHDVLGIGDSGVIKTPEHVLRPEPHGH